ncbi:ABC transporter substrate-binding protein [Streptomyces sp. NPDC001642]|uniref:ABC transporter substrate-binding protein n=1 Tax=Streptomyces sp. NPDC001642 TaxID=3154392 RepID=UPI0033345ADF
MKPCRIAMVLVAVSALTVAGCTAAGQTSNSSSGSPSGGSLTVLVAADGGQNYDPQTNAAPSSGEFMVPVFDTLLKEDAHGAMAPGLATAWTYSADGRTLTLTLRDGVKFQDGTAFDAAAVKSNIERGQTNPKSVVRSQLAAIGSVDAKDATTVVLHLKSPAGALLGYFAGPAGMMGSPQAWQNANYATHPVGTGPWQVSDSSQPGSDMVYTVAKNYWNPSVQKVSTIHIRVGAESTFVPGLTGRSVQAVMLTGAPTDGRTLSSAGLPVADSGISYLHLLYLNKSGVFADPRVRAAVSVAIDRKAICDSLLGGACTLTGQPVQPGSWAYDTSLVAPKPDVDRAKALLTQAGHPKGISFTAVVASTGTQLQTELTAIQQMLAKARITMIISPRPVAQLLPALDGGRAQAYYSVNTGGADPAIPLATMSAPAYNPGGYSDPTLAAALAAADAATTQTARTTAYRKVSAAYQDASFNIVVLNQKLQYATAKGVSGISARDPLVLDMAGAGVS